MTVTFGWKSQLLTGWLGTPIHELSHAVMCLLFLHRIKDVALFRPNEKTGTLGYVHHEFNPRNLYHQIGNFFIGIAPVIGGCLVLYLIMPLLVLK